MLEDFADLGEYPYPGSRERRQTVPLSRPLEAEPLDEDVLGKGTIMILHGEQVEFFTIGQVARAIGRSAVTLRGWEAKGVIPQSGYWKPSDDPRGRRRLYTRAQAEGLVVLAIECDVLDARSRRPLDEFKARAWALFNELKKGRA